MTLILLDQPLEHRRPTYLGHTEGRSDDGSGERVRGSWSPFPMDLITASMSLLTDADQFSVEVIQRSGSTEQGSGLVKFEFWSRWKAISH